MRITKGLFGAIDSFIGWLNHFKKNEKHPINRIQPTQYHHDCILGSLVTRRHLVTINFICFNLHRFNGAYAKIISIPFIRIFLCPKFHGHHSCKIIQRIDLFDNRPLYQ